MGAGLIIIKRIQGQNPAQMLLAKDQDVIQAVAPERPDQVLDIWVVASENPVQIDSRSAAESEHHRRMIALGLLFLRLLCDRFKPRQQLEAEILVLRHQLNILQQRAPGRPHFRWVDRALFIWLYRRCPLILNAIAVARPETVLRWHRMGFAAYWRWKSRSPGGRPRIAKEMRDLIRRTRLENPLSLLKII